jgi:hypothetical protein
MRRQPDHAPHPLLWIGSIAAILLAGAMVAGMARWAANMEGPRTGIRSMPARDIISLAKCEECGVVAFTREIASSAAGADSDVSHASPARVLNKAAPMRYEITVRMRDGSSHVFTDTTRWRRGERVIVIDAK